MNIEKDYPELTALGALEAQRLIDRFKNKLVILSNEILGDLYSDVAVHIESDSWTNYRNKMVEGFCEYDTSRDGRDYKMLRAKILSEHRESIIQDLNQDLLKEIESLKMQLMQQREIAQNYRGY